MQFTFHNSYGSLELVPSRLIFWTELSCWRKSYLNKTALLQGWSHRYKNATVIITIWLTATKYPYLEWKWIFYLLRRCFFPLSLSRSLPTWLFIWLTWRVYFKKQELLTPPDFWLGPSCSSFYFFFCCPIMCLYILGSVLWRPLKFPHKKMFGSSLPPVVWMRVHVLFTLFVFVCA
jgi:hypothetical protein